MVALERKEVLMELTETIIDLPPEEDSDEFLRVRKCEFDPNSGIETEYWIQRVAPIEGGLITVLGSARYTERGFLLLVEKIMPHIKPKLLAGNPDGTFQVTYEFHGGRDNYRLRRTTGSGALSDQMVLSKEELKTTVEALSWLELLRALVRKLAR
tara:strand:- start:8614 stop:9078 length:465 start_codon:yes stop_codon:yes gene_type:complete